MSNRFEWSGLEDFKAWLRKLPDNLTGEASFIVNGAANEAARRIVDRYASGPTGDLKEKVTVKPMRNAPGGKFGIGVVVISSSNIANIYENGTQVRHNAFGANRGRMPAKHVVVQEVTSHRRQMYQKLFDLLERNGMRVSGTP
jgi:hypothetical protein